MKSLVCFVLLLQLYATCLDVPTYHAAVVEYNPFSVSITEMLTNDTLNDLIYKIMNDKLTNYPTHSKASAKIIMQRNAKEYTKYIAVAAILEAQIVVFPEYSLTTLYGEGSDIWATLVPHPRENMILHQSNSEDYPLWLKDISRQADLSDIYVVINLIERAEIDGKNYFFNTNVAFGKDGKVIGKYRKENLFNEPTFNSGKGFNDDAAFFTTDFNVTFGMITCFDVLFHQPAITRTEKVGNIIMTTAWTSTTPFLPALGIQAGYARATGINLLVAGYSSLTDSLGGSGIYNVNGPMKTFLPKDKESIILTADLPSISKPKFSVDFPKEDEPREVGPARVDDLTSLKEGLSGFEFVNIDSNNRHNQKLRLCKNDTCCELEVKVHENGTGNIRYKLAIHAGIIDMPPEQMYADICGIIACDTSSCETQLNPSENYGLKTIKLTGTFKSKNYGLFYPTTLRFDMKPLDFDEYTYEATTKGDTITIKMVAEQLECSLMTFSIYGTSSGTSSGTQIKNSFFLLILTMMVTLFRQ